MSNKAFLVFSLAILSFSAFAGGDDGPAPKKKPIYPSLNRQKPRIGYQVSVDRAIRVENGCQVVAMTVVEYVPCSQVQCVIGPDGCARNVCVTTMVPVHRQVVTAIPTQQYEEFVRVNAQPVFIDSELYRAERERGEIMTLEEYNANVDGLRFRPQSNQSSFQAHRERMQKEQNRSREQIARDFWNSKPWFDERR